jgi:DNA-binding MarR family transcriptional regulator
MPSRVSIDRQNSTINHRLALADRLHSAAIHLLRRVRKQDAATGEGPARLSALSVLVFAGPKTLGELAAAEQVKPPTMSRIVTGLARSRLITVTPDPHDARRLQIRSTAKGTRLLHKGRQLRIAYLAAHLDLLPPDQLAKLDEAMEILQSWLAGWVRKNHVETAASAVPRRRSQAAVKEKEKENNKEKKRR